MALARRAIMQLCIVDAGANAIELPGGRSFRVVRQTAQRHIDLRIQITTRVKRVNRLLQRAKDQQGRRPTPVSPGNSLTSDDILLQVNSFSSATIQFTPCNLSYSYGYSSQKVLLLLQVLQHCTGLMSLECSASWQ